MALKDLITDLGSFYENNPFAAKFKTKAGSIYAQKSGFNQRSFKYGDDRPGGGSSKQPFVKSVLPDVNSDPTSATGLLAGITRQITARVDDLERIGKYLITPKGLQFIAKQELLSAQNPIVPGRPNRYPIVPGEPGEPDRFNPLKGFYNPLNTLAQVAASGTGVHLEKQGLLPIGFEDDGVKYEKVYKESSQENLFTKTKTIKLGGNRLALLQNLTATGTPLSKSDLTAGVSYNVGSDILSYNGGPGILTTNIRYADNSVYQGSAITNGGSSTYTLKQLYEQDSVGSPGILPENIGLITKDFRSKIPVKTENKKIGVFGKNAVDYTSDVSNKILRVGLGDPGRRDRDRSNLYKSDKSSVDKVAALPLYKSSKVLPKTSYSRDFIRFRFEVLDNNNTSLKTYVHFRAFLGAITDNFGGLWNDSSFVGRGDKFHTYTGFSRDISLSFKVHPQTREEQKAMYQKLTYLASTLAPDYSGGGGYMKGNIVKLTIGSYFYSIPGFITSLTYTVPEEASWEIAYNEPEGGEESTVMEAPRHFDVNLSFTPIHNFAPQLLDGTRKYALFTPDGETDQPNPFLPKNGSIIYAQRYTEVSVDTDGDGESATVRTPSGLNGREKALQVVNSIPTSIITATPPEKQTDPNDIDSIIEELSSEQLGLGGRIFR